MEDYKPNRKNLKYIVDKAYFAITGDNDQNKREQVYAGVDAMIKLYKENPTAFYAALSTLLFTGADALNLHGEARDSVYRMADHFAQKSTYTSKQK